MNEPLPRPRNTLAVILGASEFPKAGELLASQSFRRSAEGVRDYLLDRDGYGLSGENLLYLFDSPKTASDMDEAVSDFLQSRVSVGDNEEPATDLIVYYVGHGGFGATDADYYLAIRATRVDNPVMSSYSVQSLATTLKKRATHLRRYVILDSCFSAAAYQHFQNSGPLQVAVQKTKAVLPLKGTALLCASGPRNPAKAPPGAQYTMFSGALISALKEGIDLDLLHFSIQQLSEIVEENIRKTYDDEAVRPEVHFPNQPEGLIGRIPLFPNPRRSSNSLKAQLDALGPVVQGLKDELVEARQQNAVTRAALEMVQTEVAAVTRRVAVLEDFPEDPTLGTTSNQRHFVGSYALKEDEWKRLPGDVKGMMLEAARARQHGLAWLCICLFVTTLALAATFSPTIGRPFLLIAVLVVFLLAFINLLGVVREWIESHTKRSSDAEEDWWDKLEAVVALRTVHVVMVFPGFRITGVMLYASFILCLIGLTTSLTGYLSLARFVP